jgi:exodeoxyribonuclease-3
MLKIVTWNINSVRIRTGLLKQLVKKWNPDIICLQETKVEDALFPLDVLKSLGFDHIYFSGQKSYNGVAILSKVPLSDVHMVTMAKIDHKRHIAATLPDGRELHNFYVPAGGDLPDPEQNPSFRHKLDFVEDMTKWSKRSKGKSMIILGDFNIAPLEHDVWSSKQLRNVVSHTEPERTRLNDLQATLDWIDIGRHFVPHDQKLYSWWSYRNRDWKASNRGRRLDHIWCTPDMKSCLKSFEILPDARDWEGPSDHVPVMAVISK